MSLYLVTGGCGFIGSHLVDSLLSDGHRVRILDDLSTGRRENVSGAAEVIVGNVADRGLVGECMSGVEGCFHLAAIASVQRSIEDWLGTHHTNLSGTICVLDAARTVGGKSACPVVLASSAAVYGACEQFPLSEDAPKNPLSAYGADKLGCELHGRVAATIFGIPTTAMRFFNVYGPRQDPTSPYSGVISIFCNRLVQEVPLTIYGDGLQCRDFIYVGDVVRFLRKAMDDQSPAFKVFNICTGLGTNLTDLAKTMMDVASTRVEVKYATPRPGDIRRSVGTPASAEHHLGIKARTSLKEGLEATITWLKNS